ncbi:MAG: methionyl-tRNA formyltransferase [Gammaproteobacteria bacterium]|nr:methionyl-tRNA formyltransferase [Gammaproteobacteria bacterium]
MHALKIVFAGTPPFAAQHLETLLNTSHEVIGVYTQPDRVAGRGKQLQQSAVKSVAIMHGLPVFQPASLRSPEEQQILAALNPDVMIVVAYGLLLPQEVLDIPKFGCINVHASLLPRWRGAAPIERALLAGDRETGVTIMQMDKGLDTGAMLYKLSVDISDIDDRQTLEDKLAAVGRVGLVHCLENLEAMRSNAQTQDDSLSTYARKLEKSESLIDWSQNASSVNRRIRGGIGRTPAYSFLQGERIRLLHAQPHTTPTNLSPGTIVQASKECLSIACLDSILDVTMLQMPGKNALHISEILNSRRELFAAGQRFTDTEAPAT